MNFLLVANDPKLQGAPTPVIAEPLFIEPTPAQISAFFGSLVVSAIVVFLLYVILFYGLRLLLRRMEKEIGLITLNVSQIPVLAILILFGLKTSFQLLGRMAVVSWIGKALTALIVVAVSYWIAQIFTQVIAYYLKKYAQQSEAAWDDVLVPFLETAIPLGVYLIGGFLFLQAFGVDLTGLWVAFGGATFVLGFALQSILANFFSGLVLLIDTPFQFGDVISMPDGSLAVIKKIGIRVTTLFLIDTNCEVFVPNGALQSQKLINLSRPSPHYYYSIDMPLRADTEPAKAIEIINEAILAHPDTLGNIDEKLKLIDKYYKTTEVGTEFSEFNQVKKEIGRQRLLAEREVNKKLQQIHQALEDLVEKIQILEKGGLETEESRKIQGYYLDIVKLIGLELVTERQGKRRLARLEEAPEENSLIVDVRTWYKTWSKDPNLSEEDSFYLQEEWERKVELLKLRANRLFQKISQPKVDERKLDDYVIELIKWLGERFKNTQTSWQAPKIWTDSITPDMMGAGTVATMDYVVKFFVDNIKLEQCQRGYRVKGEVHGEMIRQLRQVYIYR
jgi:MscS family membrane protein